MVTNNHYIELYINKELVELESQESLGLRINNVVFNPTKTTTTQAEYSYSFNIPSTPVNDRILQYANTLSKPNKFHARYSSQVYADGEIIFDGSLTVQKYNSSKKEYECNLVNIKINTLDEIFGEMKMTDLKWEVPFDGAPTINAVNSDMTTKYFFPLVAYGVFQKKYISKDEVSADYTGKFEIDKYNRFWIESFYPSLNMMECLRKALEQKGYVVGGSAFSDPNISNAFASTNLANEQSPIYNLGNPKFGHLDISATITTNGRGVGYQQELNFPYYKVRSIESTDQGINVQEEYNFSGVNLYNALSGTSPTLASPSYMYDPNEMVIVVPADGFYKVEMSVGSMLNTTGSLTVAQWTTDGCKNDLAERNVTVPVGFLNNVTPLEIQLVRNFDDNVELIKGKWNTRYEDGDPTHSTRHCTVDWNNVIYWETCAPHEDPYQSEMPTKTNDLQLKNTRTGLGGRRSDTGTGNLVQDENGNWSSGNNDVSGSGNFSGYRGGTRGTSSSVGGRTSTSTERKWSKTNMGYVYVDNNESSQSGKVKHTNIMAYDRVVSPAFICGMSTMSSGVTAVMKNGYSWSKSESARNDAFYKEIGYKNVVRTTAGTVVEEDGNGFNKNEYLHAPSAYTIVDNTSLSGYVTCMVWLNKNDIIEPFIVQREYHNEVGASVLYNTTTNINVKLTAFSSDSYFNVKARSANDYNLPTEFPVNLNLFNFTNKDTKVVDWINNVTKAFNLELTQDGSNIDIDINRGVKKSVIYAVDLDDRVNSDEAESEFISYPRQMSVQYKIDIDEYGFEYSVPLDHINDDDWYKYGDSGFTIINLSDDSYETSTQNTQTNFSYSWYCPFTWKEVTWDSTRGYVETGLSATTMLPVIEKSSYMADGYGYEEAMKHDGYSLTQRFWFRQPKSSQYCILSDNQHEQVYFTYPTNSYDGFHLSYKDTEKSIVSEYFNIAPMLSSNYVNIDAYLTPTEYKSLKGGAMVKFDSNLHYVSEINGYDPSGFNKTSLKLITKP